MGTPPTPVWNRRLITPERALSLGGDWLLALSAPEGVPAPELRCAACRRLVLVLGWRVTVDELLAAVLRHAVIHHELSLSASPTEGADDVRGPRGTEGAGHPDGLPPGGEPDADPGRRLDEAPAGRRTPGRS